MSPQKKIICYEKYKKYHKQHSFIKVFINREKFGIISKLVQITDIVRH